MWGGTLVLGETTEAEAFPSKVLGTPESPVYGRDDPKEADDRKRP